MYLLSRDKQWKRFAFFIYSLCFVSVIRLESRILFATHVCSFSMLSSRFLFGFNLTLFTQKWATECQPLVIFKLDSHSKIQKDLKY